MTNNRYFRSIALLIAGLLLVPFFTGLAGCSRQITGQAEDMDSGPFQDDRVVTVRIVMPEDDWEFLQKYALAEQYARSDLWYDGELVPDIALRPKGNSSLTTTFNRGSIRFSLKADLNFFNSARNLYGVKKLNFNNGFSDPTFMREVLAYELYEQMGLPTPRTAFADLWVNDTHLGLYTMVEQIDKTFLSNHFNDPNGNLYKPVAPAAYLDWTEADLLAQQARQINTEQDVSDDALNINLGGGRLGEIIQALGDGGLTAQGLAAPPSPPLPPGGIRPPGGAMPPGNTPLRQQRDFVQQMGLKTNENKPDHSALFRFLDILNNEPNASFPQEIEKVLDVDQVLRFLAVSTTVVHLDNYTGQFGHNYYLYESNGKFTIIPWDLNMAFGTFNNGIDRQGIINFYIDEPTSGPVAERPLVSRLLSVPSYLETYHGYLSELINGPFSLEVMEPRINELADIIRPYVQDDTSKFFTTREFEMNLREGVRPRNQVPGMQLSIGLKAFVRERAESIHQQLVGIKPSTNYGKGNEGKMMLPGRQPRLPRNR